MRFILLLLPLLLTNCLKTDIIYGSGTLSTETIVLDTFNGKLHLNINTPITINQGEPQLSITTDDNLHEYIIWDTTDGSLSINQDQTYKLTSTDLAITLTLPSLLDVTIDSNRVESMIMPDTSFMGTFRGNAEFISNVKLSKASLSVTESAVVDFKGDITNLSLLVTSDQKQRLEGLEIYHADVEIATAQLTELNVRSTIKGILAGSGDLSLRVYPPLENMKFFGTGEIVYADTIPDSTIIDTTSYIVPSDSINLDSLALLDSIAVADSLALLDSIAVADSLAQLDSTSTTSPAVSFRKSNSLF